MYYYLKDSESKRKKTNVKWQGKSVLKFLNYLQVFFEFVLLSSFKSIKSTYFFFLSKNVISSQNFYVRRRSIMH